MENENSIQFLNEEECQALIFELEKEKREKRFSSKKREILLNLSQRIERDRIKAFPFIRNVDGPLFFIAEKIKKLKETFPSQNLFIGISGLQGTGKTFNAFLLKEILENLEENLKVEVASIDDFYLPFASLQSLKSQFPCYKFRGPPGTHDLNLLFEAKNILKGIQQGDFIRIPVYDKGANNGLGDRAFMKEVPTPHIFILEGWFNNYYSLECLPENFQTQLSLKANEELKKYEEIWRAFDFSIAFLPLDPSLSFSWRAEAESRMREENNGQGMTQQMVKEFVEYFFESLPPSLHLSNLSKISSISFSVDEKRSFSSFSSL